MKFRINPIYGTLEVNDAGTVESIESSKILPTVGTIAAGVTAVVDTIDYSNFFAVRYFIAIKSADNKTNMFDYAICNDGAGGLKETVFGQIFGGLSLVVSSIVDTGNVKFKITNNELTTITYKIQKLGF